eukprot:SAG11_NODE_3837_length_2195_cov_4.506679_2_plen_302_part_00
MGGARGTILPPAICDDPNRTTTTDSNRCDDHAGRTRVASVLDDDAEEVQHSNALSIAQGGSSQSGWSSAEMGGDSTSMADRRMALMRSALQARGLFPAAMERILRQWRAKQMRVHQSYFDNFFVPFCRAWGYDPFEFRSDSLVNCLEANLQRIEVLAARAGKPAQHGSLKKLRAAVSETWKILYGSRITFHPDVEDFFKTARIEAPLTRGYSTTWDISLIFDYYQHVALTGLGSLPGLPGPLSNDDLPEIFLRDKAITLAKIKIGCRSGDLTKVFRRWVHSSTREAISQPCLMGTGFGMLL